MKLLREVEAQVNRLKKLREGSLMGRKIKIGIEEGYLYIDEKPMQSIYQVAENTYIITTLPERCKIVKRDNLDEVKRLEEE